MPAGILPGAVNNQDAGSLSQASRMVPMGSGGYLSPLLGSLYCTGPAVWVPTPLLLHSNNTFPLSSPHLQTEGKYPILSTLDPIQEIYVPASYKSIWQGQQTVCFTAENSRVSIYWQWVLGELVSQDQSPFWPMWLQLRQSHCLLRPDLTVVTVPCEFLDSSEVNRKPVCLLLQGLHATRRLLWLPSTYSLLMASVAERKRKKHPRRSQELLSSPGRAEFQSLTHTQL